MTNATTCPTARDGDDEVARNWVAGSLKAEEASEFEAHFQACAQCKRAVDYAAGITADLRAAAHSRTDARSATKPWWLWSVVALATVSLALALLAA